ncbi:MAG: SH3 domain-containing protein [Bacteroidia bacterium]
MDFRLFTPLLFLLILSCGNPPAKEAKPPQSVPEDTLVQEILSEGSGENASFNAFIVGKNVRARELPSLDDSVVRTFQSGTPIQMIQPIGERISITAGDACDEFGYPWYEVDDLKGNRSFVFGKFIFQTHPENIGPPWYTTVSMQRQTWGLGMAKDLSIGPSDEEGLTGCESLFIPYLYLGNEQEIYPIYCSDKTVAQNGNWASMDRFDSDMLFMIFSSDGTSTQLEKFMPLTSEKGFELQFNFQHQEGSERIAFHITEENGKFQLNSWKPL